MKTHEQYQVTLSPEFYEFAFSTMSTPQKPRKSCKQREVTQETKDYSDFKSDGIRKAHAADSIRSYDDFASIQKYYLDRHRYRDWAMWTIGVSLGLRVSDLLSLQFKNVLNADGSFKPRIQIYEKKTGKMNECLITEAVQKAISFYIKKKGGYYPDEYLFSSGKTHGKMYEESGWRILSEAGKYLKLPLNIGSHTMRKSFANIVACVDKSNIDMNTIVKIQGLLNHSDQKITMKYLGSFKIMYDKAREAVSDFVLGKTDVNELIAGSQVSLGDLMDKMDAIEQKIMLERNMDEEQSQSQKRPRPGN